MEEKKVYKAQINITGGKKSSGLLSLLFLLVFMGVPMGLIFIFREENLTHVYSNQLIYAAVIIVILLIFFALVMTNGFYRDVWWEGANLAVKNKRGKIKYYPVTNRTKLKGWKVKANVTDMGEVSEYTFIAIFSRLKGFTIETKDEKELDELVRFVRENTGREVEVL